MKFAILLFIVTLLTVATFHLGLAQDSDQFWVVDVPVLNMRAAPDAQSSVISLLSVNDRVRLIALGPSALIDQLDDIWVHVSYQTLDGWVFRPYLRPLEFENKPYISAARARRCCGQVCRLQSPNADCGETCYGDGYIALLRYGWTPTRKEWVGLDHYRPFATPYPKACQ